MPNEQTIFQSAEGAGIGELVANAAAERTIHAKTFFDIEPICKTACYAAWR